MPELSGVDIPNDVTSAYSSSPLLPLLLVHTIANSRSAVFNSVGGFEIERFIGMHLSIISVVWSNSLTVVKAERGRSHTYIQTNSKSRQDNGLFSYIR
jgi:hypothetical protein